MTWPTSTSYKAFLKSGPSMPIPIHATSMEEGTTIEMWFYISSTASDTTWYLNLYSYLSTDKCKIYFKDGNFLTLYTDFY